MKLNVLVKTVAIAAALTLTASAASAAQAPGQLSFDELIGQAKASMMADPGQALSWSDKALMRARAAGTPDQDVRVATAQWLKGEALLRLNRAEAAEPVINQALAVAARRRPDSDLHGRLMLAHGDLLQTRGQAPLALKDFQAAYEIFGRAKEPRNQAMALQLIGSVYEDARDYPKVLQYYAQSAETYKGDAALLVAAYNNTGTALKDMGRLPEAIADLRRALKVAEDMDSPVLRARILTNLAAAEAAAGRLNDASVHIQQGLLIAAKDPDAREWRPFLWGVSAQVALRRGDKPAAAALLEQTFSGLDLDATDVVFRDFHETAYKVYEALGDDRRALQHLKAFKRLEDQATAVAASTNAALASAQFDFAVQQSRIAQLKAAQLQKDIQLAHSRAAMGRILLLGSALLVALLLIGFLNIRRSRNQTRAANARLSAANEALEEAVRARTDFLAATSHEIRTPLNGILGMTQVILADPKLTRGLRDKVAVVHGAGETMLALVDDILDMAKIESGNLTVTPADMDLKRLLEDAAKLWADRAEAKGLKLELDAEDAPGWIVADAGRLRQVLFNLMSNAIKFTDAGLVSLSARIEMDGDQEMLALAVADTGVGVPPEHQEAIFESFRQVDSSRTRAHGGTGLGLAICLRLAQAMGGDISVVSRPGEGSTFCLRLPLVRAIREAHPAARTGLGRASILVVEANPLTQSLLRTGLAAEARNVEIASSLTDGLISLAGGKFDVVIADLGCLAAGAADAALAVRRLALASPETQIVVLSPAEGDHEAWTLTSAGAARVIKKPITMPALARELAALDGPARKAARREATAA